MHLFMFVYVCLGENVSVCINECTQVDTCLLGYVWVSAKVLLLWACVGTCVCVRVLVCVCMCVLWE